MAMLPMIMGRADVMLFDTDERTIMARFLLVLTLLSAGFDPAWAQEPARPKSAVVELFEDDAEGMLKLLTNPEDAPGRAEPEANVVFSGTKSIKVTQYQRFHRRLPGWKYAI